LDVVACDDANQALELLSISEALRSACARAAHVDAGGMAEALRRGADQRHT
jgi:hypothetical protein